MCVFGISIWLIPDILQVLEGWCFICYIVGTSLGILVLEGSSQIVIKWYPPPKFNMEPENDGFQVRNLLFQGLLFRFHVKFLGCSGWKYHDDRLINGLAHQKWSDHEVGWSSQRILTPARRPCGLARQIPTWAPGTKPLTTAFFTDLSHVGCKGANWKGDAKTQGASLTTWLDHPMTGCK